MTEPTSSREDFARAYADRSDVPVEWLKSMGREVRPCDCDWDGCEGWQMAYVGEEVWFARAMGNYGTIEEIWPLDVARPASRH